MPLSLQRLAPSGETAYIAKHNANAAAIEQALVALESLLGSSMGAAVSVGAAFQALLGTSPSVIGSTSYKCTGSGTTLTVQAGYTWLPASGLVVSTGGATLSFNGVSAGTYYIKPDASGIPQRVTNSVDALYSVVWSGSSFGTITRLAKIVWGAADWIAAQDNAALGTTYETFDALLEALGTRAVAGDLARTAQKGRLSKSLTTGANVTLTAEETNNSILNFTGAPTADIDVNLNTSGPRFWVVTTAVTGSFSVTLKAGGAGLKLQATGSMFVFYDGSSLQAISTGVGSPTILALTTAATQTADFARGGIVRATLTSANTTFTLTGGKDGQRYVLELTQDGTGGRTATFGSEVNLGADIGSITLSTVAGKRDYLGFIYNAGSGKYDLVSIMHGY